MGARQNNLHYAQQCAKLGLHVFPCRPEDKYPLVKWRKLSTTEPEQIKQWWAEWPDALPGIDLAKSGHVVIDGDRHGGPDGVVAVEHLFAKHTPPLPARQVSSHRAMAGIPGSNNPRASRSATGISRSAILALISVALAAMSSRPAHSSPMAEAIRETMTPQTYSSRCARIPFRCCRNGSQPA